MHFKSSLGLNGLMASSSVYKYQDDNKEVKFFSGGVSVGVVIVDNRGKAGFEAKLDVVNLEVNSLETNVVGCGIKIGKEVGISTPIGGVSLDIGNLIKTSMTILDNIAGGSIMDKMAGINIPNGDQLYIIVETISNGDLLTSTKAGKEICINTLTGGELINIDNPIAEATCNNDIKVGNETGINTLIGDLINTITDVLNSNKNGDTNVTDFGIKVGEKVGANITDFGIKVGEKVGEKISANITDFGIKVGEKIGANITDFGIKIGEKI
ncbi:9895_t:CDS:2, partial [Dentiscutata erythropus]